MLTGTNRHTGIRTRTRIGRGDACDVATAAAWLWALLLFSGKPVLLGAAVLACSLGLRHGLDPDHIAAIDNVTSKLMQAGKRPVAVGFLLALGHFAVVVLASIAIALAASALTGRFAGLPPLTRPSPNGRRGRHPQRGMPSPASCNS